VWTDKSCPVPRGSRARINHSHLMRVGEGASSGRLAPAPASAGHVAAPDPPPSAVCPDGREEVPDPYEGSGISAVGSELPLLRDTWRHRTCPRAGTGSGAVGPAR